MISRIAKMSLRNSNRKQVLWQLETQAPRGTRETQPNQPPRNYFVRIDGTQRIAKQVVKMRRREMLGVSWLTIASQMLPEACVTQRTFARRVQQQVAR